MYSEALHGQIMKVMSFTWWLDMYWYDSPLLYPYMSFDDLRCYSSVCMSWSRCKWLEHALNLLRFDFKCSWHSIVILRNNCPEMFCKICVRKSFVKFLGRQLYRSRFFNKVGDQLKKRLRNMCVPMKYT